MSLPVPEDKMTDQDNLGIDRRTFVKQAAGALLATGMDARSYARVLGANDRIRIGQLGCGDRSQGHVHMVHLAALPKKLGASRFSTT